MLYNEQELLDYLTENYSDRKSPAKKEWTFQEHFNLIPEFDGFHRVFVRVNEKRIVSSAL